MMRLLSSERRLHAKGVAASLPREVGTSSGADSSAFLSRPWPFSPTRAWSTARPCGTPFRRHGPEHRDGSRRMRVGDRCRALGRGRRAARSIRFSHDLVRQTLEESLSRARQVRLHARIALTIQASGTPNPEQVVSWARHLTVAAPLVGSAAAVPYLVAGSDDALPRFANDQAEQDLRAALALVAQVSDPAERSPRGSLARTPRATRGQRPGDRGKRRLLVRDTSPLSVSHHPLRRRRPQAGLARW